MFRLRLVLLLVFVVLGALLLFLYPRKSAFPPLPEPNGYDVFVQTAAKITRSQKSPKELTADELVDLVAKNRAALNELRRGLEVPSAVPVWMSEDWTRTQTMHLPNLKAAALAMDAEALLLHQQGDVEGALDECFNLLRFGQAIARHGVLINSMVGTTCEVMAVRRMTNLLADLSAADCKRAALALQEHEARREPFDAIMKREKEWARRTFGVVAQIRETVQTRLFRQKNPWSFLMPDAAKEYRTRTLEARMLMLKLASRAFEIERRRSPQRASELVPDFLRAVPIDPVTQAPLELP